ncbi:hypothetical protein KKC17_02430 [Patescibacteria group bacterium]|nr:hypothetical protein [Patescibacteria group bacterium]
MIWRHLITLGCIALGESLMILAQVYGAKASSLGQPLVNFFKLNNWYGWVTILGALIVLLGYLYGIKSAGQNIWLVTLTSWTAIIIVEVSLNWFVFGNLPQSNVRLGFILVLIGFILANI